MTLSNHGNVVTSPDTIKKGMTATLRFSYAGVIGIHRPLRGQYLGHGSCQEGIRFISGILRRKELSVRAPSWGIDGAKGAQGVGERRSRAGRLYVVIYWWGFRKRCLASGSRGLGGGPLKVRAQVLMPAALWHAFLLSGSLPCLPCHTDWNLPKVLHNVNIFSLPLFLPGIRVIATTQKRLTHMLGPANSQDL